MRLNPRIIGPGILGGTLLGLVIAALPNDQRQLESAMWQDYCQGVAQWHREANNGVPASERFGHPDYENVAHRCPPREGLRLTVSAGASLASN